MKNHKKTEVAPASLDQAAERIAGAAPNTVNTELYDPLGGDDLDLRRAMPGVLRRAQIDAERRS